jgi:hypothetical protein
MKQCYITPKEVLRDTCSRYTLLHRNNGLLRSLRNNRIGVKLSEDGCISDDGFSWDVSLLCCSVKQFELAEGLKWTKRSATEWFEARHVRSSISRRIKSGGKPVKRTGIGMCKY